MDAIVQLVRNAMCCIKDLGIFSDTFLYDAEATSVFFKDLYSMPEPFNKATPLEVAISITQLFACVSTTVSGLRLIFSSGYGKMGRIAKLIEKRPTHPKTQADMLVDESLSKEMHSARRSIFVGLNVLSIGVSFFWLFANSWHVTETNWIGGIQGLIHALTVMSVALVPLLYLMIADSIELVGKAARIEYLVSILRKCGSSVPTEIMTAETFDLVAHRNWSPFWAGGLFTMSTSAHVSEQKRLDEEVATLQSALTSLVKSDDKVYTKQAIQETADKLEAEVPSFRYQAYREFLYFVINTIAFYGYFLGILTFYAHPDDEFQSTFVRTLKFGMTNADADWRGNFAGDLMWTIEPMIILWSPALIAWLKPKKVAKKSKSD
jgi:hypothetical protein